ncbi:MAG: hypothetical protein JEY79_11705 [Pseudodesulfovibrio sp.]|nr:hypothetical protein [Pseudodesulfovibrio sp.]
MLCAFQIEITIRELDGVLYQALHLASHGLPTLLGDRMVNEYVMSSQAPLIYFDSDQQKLINTTVLNNNGIVLNLNSEGQGFVDDPFEMQKNFAKVVDSVSNICVWGQKQQEILSSLVPKERIKDLVITGYPSFDLTFPRFTPFFRNNKITRDHGDDYILINTSFGMFNHEMGLDYYLKMLSKMKEWEIYGTPEYRALLNRRSSHQERTALALIDLAKKLARAYPTRHIIIRPHPAENGLYYSSKLSEYSNIYIIKNGSAREWIATASAVIHHDCTTGLEAMLMGKQVLQYEPYEGTEGAATLMTQIGLRATTPSEALEYLRQGTMPKNIKQEFVDRLTPYLANLEINSSKTIADLASSFSQDKETWLPEPLGLWGNIKCWRKYISKLIRARQPGRNGRKVRYALNKFPRLRREEVVLKLDKLRSIEPELPEVDVKELCLNTFLITPRSN